MSPPVPPDPLADFRAAVRPAGLQLVGVVDGDAARAYTTGRGPNPLEGSLSPLDGAASVLVVASGGRTFWEQLPADLAGTEHPIDQAGQRVIGAALHTLPAGARLLPQVEADRLDLRRLAAAAGIGVISPHLELLLNPTYGPWISVRGVVTLPVHVRPTAMAAFDPCGPCARPCLDACPVSAYSRATRFDVKRCGTHRLADEASAAAEDARPNASLAPTPIDAPSADAAEADQARSPQGPCASRCASRDACVVGPEHRYGDKEMRHRHRAGLPMLRAWLRG